MPLTDAIAGQAANDTQFTNRVKAALMKACPAIQFESAGTNNHAVRIALVGRILATPDAYAQRFAPAVACDGTLFAAVSTLTAATDAQIETAVSGLIDMFALQNA